MFVKALSKLWYTNICDIQISVTAVNVKPWSHSGLPFLQVVYLALGCAAPKWIVADSAVRYDESKLLGFS